MCLQQIIFTPAGNACDVPEANQLLEKHNLDFKQVTMFFLFLVIQFQKLIDMVVPEPRYKSVLFISLANWSDLAYFQLTVLQIWVND